MKIECNSEALQTQTKPNVTHIFATNCAARMCRALSDRRSVSHWKERPQRMRRSIIVSPRKMPCFPFIFDLHEWLSRMFCYFFCTRTKAPMATVCLLLGAFGFAESLTDESQKANDGEWDDGGIFGVAAYLYRIVSTLKDVCIYSYV
jgi:hypothetical protein